MSKVRRTGSDASNLSLESLVSVGLNGGYEDTGPEPEMVTRENHTEEKSHRVHVSLDSCLERLLGQQVAASTAIPIECHEFGYLVFHTVPSSVRKGTHKLLLNNPKFHVEFRTNPQLQTVCRTVKLWAKIGPKGVLDRSSVIDNSVSQPSLQCNHDNNTIFFAPPHRIPTHEGVQPISVKGKMSGTTVPSFAVLAQAQFEVGENKSDVIHLQGDFNTSVDGTRHQLILPRGGAAKGLSHLFTFSVEVQVSGEHHMHIFSRDFDVVFAADRKLRKAPQVAAELGLTTQSNHSRQAQSQSCTPTTNSRVPALSGLPAKRPKMNEANPDTGALMAMTNIVCGVPEVQATEVVKAGGARDRSYESYRASAPPVVEAIAAPPPPAEGTMVVVHSVVSAACVVPQVPAPAVNSSFTDDKRMKAVACAPMCAPTPQIEPKFLIKSRVRFRDKQSKEQAMKAWNRIFAPTSTNNTKQNSYLGLLWHWEMVGPEMLELTEMSTPSKWLDHRRHTRKHPEFASVKEDWVISWESRVFWDSSLSPDDLAILMSAMDNSDLEFFIYVNNDTPNESHFIQN